MFWVDRLPVDLDLREVAGARRGDVDHPAARARLDGLVRELVPRLLHLVLHLPDLLQQLVHVHAHRQSSRSRASRVALTSSRIFSSPGGSPSLALASARPSPSTNPT